ncbi:MAG: hypothetical protein AAB368_07885 [bacterium]
MSKASLRQSARILTLVDEAGWDGKAVQKFIEKWGLIRDIADAVCGGHVDEDRLRALINTIDCSVQPMIPNGWEIRPEDQIASRFRGELIWTPEKIRLHLDPGQADGGVLKGDDIRKRLEGQPVLPANVGDYLLAHPVLIPSDWKGKYIYFWGTVFHNSDNGLCVRYLCWGARGWHWSNGWLDFGWRGQGPAAVLAG